MGNIGRLICVSVPFILTALSLITLLIACLAGVSNKDLYQFKVDLSEFSVNPDSIASLIEGRDIVDDVGGAISEGAGDLGDIPDDLKGQAGDIVDDVTGGASGKNITFETLGLHELYEVSVWGFCSAKADGTGRDCTKPKMNWAEDALDTSFIEEITKAFGSDFEMPEEVSTALDVFKKVSRWTQIVFIIALVSLAAQIIIGSFSVCTRIASCLCFLIAGISTTAVIAAAALSTVTSSVVVGAVEGTSTFGGAKGSINTSYLALVWVSVAFALGASISWLVTICCCAPDKSSRRSKKHADHGEKGFPESSYQPLQDPNDVYGHGGNGGGFAHGNTRNSYYNTSQSSYGGPQYPVGGNNPRSDLAYEPYSHRA